MRKQILISLIIISSGLTMNAQWNGTNPVTTNSNIGIGTTSPNGKLEVKGNSGVYSDFASYSGTTANNYLPNGKEPTLIISENLSGTLTPAGGQITYRGGISFGRGGPGIYSINPNPAGSGYYGEIRFHTTYWNGSNYNNADRMVIKLNGDIGIGTITPDYKLDVCGTIRAKEIKVDLLGTCVPDFVFNKDYKLLSLDELEKFVTTKQHLPEIASEKEMIENGLNMKEFQMKLLQKMEEMTLYIIEQNKQLKLQSDKNEKQEQELKILKAKIKKIESIKR